jgi:pimeloyl-ACP methyl ester carboxylesterase
VSEVATAEGALTLADGRTMAFLEVGRGDGPVVVLCHPSTRSAVGWEVAEAAGVRLVFPDRPGFGRSTFKPGLSIIDWTNDVAALLTHLKVDRFYAVGVSAATPYALACGVALSDRVWSVGIIAGTVPQPAAERTGPAAMADEDPEAAFAAIRSERAVGVDHAAGARRASERPEPDRTLYARPDVQAALIAGSQESYRQGVDGPSWDTLLRIRPWGFGFDDVTVRCRWWHGADDTVVPTTLIEEAIDGLPLHSLRVVPGVGHGVCITHVEPFLRDLTDLRRP